MKARTIGFTLITVTSVFVLLAASGTAGGSGGYRFEPQPSTPLAMYGAPTRDPKLALRASGAVYMLAVQGGHGHSRLGLAISNDGGDSFAPPVPISAKEARVSSHGENSPSFAFGRSTEMYALWEESTGEGMGTNLMFARSLRFGHSWDDPLRVTDKEKPSTNAFSSMAVSPRGDVYAVWLDGRDRKMGPPGTSAVYLAKSADRGATFGKNVRVATGVCPCCRPTLEFGSGGEVHVSWRHVFPGHIRDMVVATSSDRGATFSEPVRVAKDGWKINGCPHSGASMVSKGNRLYVTWYSDGDGSNPGVRLAWSDDGANSFSQPAVVSRDILDANHPALTLAGDGRLLLTFQGRDPVKKSGWNPAGPYLVEISDEGHAGLPQAISGHAKAISYPAVVGGTVGRVYVAWTERGAKGRQIRLTRGRRSVKGELKQTSAAR